MPVGVFDALLDGGGAAEPAAASPLWLVLGDREAAWTALEAGCAAWT